MSRNVRGEKEKGGTRRGENGQIEPFTAKGGEWSAQALRPSSRLYVQFLVAKPSQKPSTTPRNGHKSQVILSPDVPRVASLTRHDAQLLQCQHRPTHSHLADFPKVQGTEHAHPSDAHTSNGPPDHQHVRRAREGLDQRSNEEDLACDEQRVLARVEVGER